MHLVTFLHRIQGTVPAFAPPHANSLPFLFFRCGAHISLLN